MTSSIELETALTQFLSSDQKEAAFKTLIKLMKSELAKGHYKDVINILKKAIIPDLDYTSALALHRIFKRVAPELDRPAQTVRLAILSSFTTKQLRIFIELFLFANGIAAHVYEADYGIFRQEILDPESGLYQFDPTVIFIATSWRDLSRKPELNLDTKQIHQLIEQELSDWENLWQTIHDKSDATIIQNNFDTPPWRYLCNHEMRSPASFSRFVTEMNLGFVERAPVYVAINDIDYLSAQNGRWRWGDERFYHHAKIPCSPEYLVDYAHQVASIISAQVGLSKKCLVLDLDNTLWGGVIGDDGIGGIKLGQGDAECEAFLSIQRYAKELSRRGVILAVCSKNEENIAKEVFEKHPEMILKLDDIACFRANWDDKASNIRIIAKMLNIGLNSLVLLDDNPAERGLVRQLAPEVAVPELPDDPTGFVQALEKHRYFQIVSLGKEDLKRTEYYRGNVERKQAESGIANVDDFLKSINMKAKIGPVNSATLERTVQLIGRSNQFNLTTRRHTTAKILEMMEHEDWITRTVSLADRFGDNGLISVFLAKIEKDTILIDTWLMSCRVLKRGVENFLLNRIVDLARSRGIKRIVGEYIPTVKNIIVKDHYQNLGFTLLQTGDSGSTLWELNITDAWTPLKTFIEEVE